ncbi:MAG TPA: hypothetical protein VG273_17925 [Bryobacteraceae bacterium]|jgi:hypothetical protein|nr:hypothetical protein [Bryobacteraceae bacterium]
MTKVQRHFRLQRPLDEAQMEHLADANSIYGIERIQISPSRDELMIEYDATRLRVTELESALQRAGIPVSGVVAAS